MNLFQRSSRREPTPAPTAPAAREAESQPPVHTPKGGLLYAIGDVHGRADLLRRLLDLVRADADRIAATDTPIIVFLGDYIDRGADSRGVVDLILELKAQPRWKIHCLRGNHDHYLLEFLDNTTNGSSWLDYGGGATLSSYGVSPPQTRSDDEGWAAAGRALAEALPPEHKAFFEQTLFAATFGDFVFVHAGVKPGVELEAQDPWDLMSIRKPFLKAKSPLPGKVVVFGHTPFPRPAFRDGKLALDTGAYATGVLTAARIHDGVVSFIQTP